MTECTVLQHNGILPVKNSLPDLFQAHGLVAPLNRYLEVEPINGSGCCDVELWYMRGISELLELVQAMDRVSLVLDLSKHSNEPSFSHHFGKGEVIILVIPLVGER